MVPNAGVHRQIEAYDPGEGALMIRVIRNDFQEAQVEELILDSLIASNKLIAFYRSSEWAVVGKDAVREQHTFYLGEERRRMIYGNDFCMK